MPYVDFPAEKVRIWYCTNLPNDDLHHLDRQKPTAVFLHGPAMDSTFFDVQFNDPRMNSKLNMIAFDSRSAGRTLNGADPSRDTWTEAADLAKAILLLGLPPVHFFAASVAAQRAAVNLACLWPYLCRSISWIGLRVSKEPEWVAPTWMELMKCLCEAEDIEAVEYVAHEAMYYWLGENVQGERKDHFAAYLATQYTGVNSSRLYDYGLVGLQREPIQRAVLESVKQPVLLVQGTFNPMYGAESPIPLEAQLLNSSYVELHTVDGPVYLHAVAPYSDVVNALFLRFVDRSSASREDQNSHLPPLRDAMRTALSKQARLLDFEEINESDPLLSSSVSRLSLADRKQRAALFSRIQESAKGRSTTCILGPDGQPRRKYSERYHQLVRKPIGSTVATGVVLVTASEVVGE